MEHDLFGHCYVLGGRERRALTKTVSRHSHFSIPSGDWRSLVRSWRLWEKDRNNAPPTIEILRTVLAVLHKFRVGVLALGFGLSVIPLPLFGDDAPHVLNPQPTVREIRAMPAARLARGVPVELTGVTSYVRMTEKDFNFNLHDGTGGVMIYPNHRLEVHPGQMVSIRGVTGFISHGLRITKATVVPGAMVGLPDARRVTNGELLDGKYEGEYVELEGVVRVVRLESPEISPRRLALDFGSRGRRLTSWITSYDPANLPITSGMMVRVKGVPVGWKNTRGQTQSMSLLANTPDDVSVISQPSDPVSLPLEEVLFWNGSSEVSIAIRTSGMVTFALPNDWFVIQDGDKAMRVRQRNPLEFAPAEPAFGVGDHVDVLGYPGIGEYTVELEDARVLSATPGALPPVAHFTDAAVILRGEGLVDRDGRLISVDGRLRALREGDERTVLEIQAGQISFSAWLPPGVAVDEDWKPGADLRLTGICALHLSDGRRRIGRSPAKFSLQLPAINGVRVLRAAPWWNASRLIAALALVGAAALLATIWAGLLEKRNQLLRTEIAARERAERELSVERRRVAGELHDTLEQTLVAASLQLHAASRTLVAQPDTAAAQLNMAAQLVARSRQEVRDAVWDLRVGETRSESLAALLARLCAESSSGASTAAEVCFAIQGVEPPLPALTLSQAIRLVREAVANALKHARPTRIDVTMACEEQLLRLTVSDNGKGFDIAQVPGPDEGHFGMAGMQERLQRLGGSIQVESAPGKGTTITFLIPLTLS